MSVKTFDTSSDLITVTDAAAEHFRQALAGTAYHGVRISVQESGCTGFKYVLKEADTASQGDVELTLSNNVRVYLEGKAVTFLRGTEIDFALEGVNRALKFNNPNVTAECGCGESFSVG